mgnify:CR=1 FL=1
MNCLPEAIPPMSSTRERFPSGVRAAPPPPERSEENSSSRAERSVPSRKREKLPVSVMVR